MPVYGNYGSVLLGATARIIVEANAKRKILYLTNHNDEGVGYIGPDGNITIDTGTPVYENQTRGDSKDFGCWLGPVYGITDGTEVDIRYWEVEYP